MIVTSVKGVEQLSADLSDAAQRAPVEVLAILTRGAVNVRRDARRAARGIGHAPSYHRAINYEVKPSLWVYTIEVGPDKGRRQGALGNILEYGTSKNAPRPHLGPALVAEEPRLVAEYEKLADRLLQ